MKNKKTTKPGMQSCAVGDPIAAYYAEVAESYLPAWMRNLREIRAGWDARVESKGGAAPPVELLNHSVVAVRTYPASMGLIGMDHRAVREVRSVALARATLDQLTTSAGVALAHEAHRQGMDVAAVDGGLRALRLAYAPNPNGDGTESGVEYPADCLWPECMSVSDRAKLDADVRGRLDSFAAALDRLNHSTGRVAAAVNAAQCPDEDDDFIFRRDGDVWRIRHDGNDLKTVRHLAGMTYIRALLSSKLPVHFTELYRIEHPAPPEKLADRQNPEAAAIAAAYGTGGKIHHVYDVKYLDQMREYIANIDSRLAEPDMSDQQRENLENKREYLDAILKQHASIRRAGGTLAFKGVKTSCTRQAIADAIKTAITAIAKANPHDKEMAKHLKHGFKYGTEPHYIGGHTWA